MQSEELNQRHDADSGLHRTLAGSLSPRLSIPEAMACRLTQLLQDRMASASGGQRDMPRFLVEKGFRVSLTETVHTGRWAVIIGVGAGQGARKRRLIGGFDGCPRWPFSGDESTALAARLSHFWEARS